MEIDRIWSDKVIVDTNILIEMIKNRVRVEDELVILSPCVTELSRLKVREAKIALEWVKKGGARVVDSELPADDAIVDYAWRRKMPVATNDKELIKRLKEKNIKVYRLRQRRYLVEV